MTVITTLQNLLTLLAQSITVNGYTISLRDLIMIGITIDGVIFVIKRL